MDMSQPTYCNMDMKVKLEQLLCINDWTEKLPEPDLRPVQSQITIPGQTQT